MAEAITFNKILTDDIVSFTTYGNNIIPNVVNAQVLAIESGSGLVNPSLAATNAANMFPTIPLISGATISSDYTSYTYLRLKLQDGTQVEIAEPWINEISLTRLQRQTATLVISDFDITQSAFLLNRLATLGFTNVQLTVS